MTLLIIEDLIGYGEKEFETLLENHPKLYYEVVIPKEYDLEENGPLFLSDFYKAIWLGQLFWRISDDFMVACGHPYKKGEFSFIIITGKVKALAKLLAFCSSVYDLENNEDGYFEFEEQSVMYENCLKPGEDIACDSLVGFLNDYADGEEEWEEIE